MKILISAFSFCPGRGSEAGRGYEIASHIAEQHDVWVVTTSEFKEEIKTFYSKNMASPRLKICYFDLPILSQIDLTLRNTAFVPISMNLYYYLWQVGLYFYARRLHQRINFDITHHVTWMRYWMPSLLAFLPPPFILGAVGNAAEVPKPLFFSLPTHGIFEELLRSLAMRMAELDPLLRLSLKYTNLALATSHNTATRLRQLGAKNVDVVMEVGFGKELNPLLNLSPSLEAKPFRVLSIARLIAWKGIHLGLQAFAQLNDPQAEYWIYGKGPQENHLKKLSQKLGINKQVHFMGHVPTQEIIQAYAKCHVLLHPALHETSGSVLVEAMAAARPVICLDWAGPSIIVTDQTGIKITPKNYSKTVTGLTNALRNLRDNINLRNNMGQAGRSRVLEHFTWQKQSDKLIIYYIQMIGSKTI